jgi:hypothetical protein
MQVRTTLRRHMRLLPVLAMVALPMISSCAKAGFCEETDNFKVAELGFYSNRQRVIALLDSMNSTSGICQAQERGARNLFNQNETMINYALQSEVDTKGRYKIDARYYVMMCTRYNMIARVAEGGGCSSTAKRANAVPPRTATQGVVVPDQQQRSQGFVTVDRAEPTTWAEVSAVKCSRDDPPVMPQAALRRGLGGIVEARGFLQAGKVTKVEIVRSVPNGIFDAAVQAAMLRYECESLAGKDVVFSRIFEFTAQ